MNLATEPNRLKGIPPNVIAWVANYYTNDHACYHLLVLNRHSLVIQAPKIHWWMVDLYMTESPESTKLGDALSSQLNAQIGIIESLIHTIDFLQHRWVYLVPLPNGQYRLIPKRPLLYRVTCPLWMPLIAEEEIQVTGYTPWETGQFGIWNGREVDIVCAWEDEFLKWVEEETIGRRAIRDLGISFEVLGHLTRDGEVVGLVMEASKGRLVEYRDRSKVYQAFTKLQQNNVIYAGGLHESNIMIHNGKVRLINLHILRVYSENEKEEVEIQAEYWHWRNLKHLFDCLAVECNQLAPQRLISMYYSYHKPISPLSNPHRPIMPILVCNLDQRLAWVVMWYNQNKRTLHRQRKQRAKDGDSLAIYEWLDSVISDYIEPEDRKLITSSISNSPAPSRAVFHPYRGRNPTSISRLSGSARTSDDSRFVPLSPDPDVRLCNMINS